MKSIYRSQEAKQKVIELYDKQMAELSIPFQDIYIETSFGRSHIIETGNLAGNPLLVFHGGNATTAYNLRYCDFLLNDFHIYAVDTIGHPGKSAENSLSPTGHAYGEWAAEVITNLGYQKMACFGGSFGAGVLVKLMCTSPEKVERSMLLVPAAIKNAPAIRSANMMFPMILYWITGKREWFIKCILPMAIKEEAISEDILVTAKCSIDNCKIKAGMPSSESRKQLEKYQGPVFVMAAQKDCLFPGKDVIKKARKAWKNCETYLLMERGHINTLSSKEKELIRDFLV